MSKCPTCGKTVYFAEKVKAAGADYHRACLKCKICGKRLEPGNFSEKENVIYCNPCYQQNFQPKGFGRCVNNSFKSGSLEGRAVEKADTTGSNSFCANCGENVVGLKFCTNCGTAVPEAQ